MSKAGVLDKGGVGTMARPRRRRKKPDAGGRIVTNGVVCYFDGSVLLIVPRDDEAQAGPAGGTTHRPT